YEGGFEWIAGIRPNNTNQSRAEITLSCNNQRGGEWRCEANVDVVLFCAIKFDFCRKRRVKLNNTERVHVYSGFGKYSTLTAPAKGYINNDKVFFEFRFNIISSEDKEAIDTALIFDLSKFSSPIEASNVTMLIGEKNLQLSKEYLAIHSPFFHAMFFGNFAENGKKEIEIKDVVYE
ncbi:hypothetical protein PENTCL1PPCAC_780, partial [Pristionchus entomophagus]